MQRIVVATENRGKMREFAALLSGLPLMLVFPRDVGIMAFPPETGETFLDNARAKATFAAGAAHLPAIADDSGLVVDALGGAPGVYSARYGGPGLSDEDRYRRVLAELRDVPPVERTARFVAAVVCVFSDGTTIEAEGRVEGVIGADPRGANGFGYDPIFVPDGFERTLAELSDDEKHAISHRGRAIRALLPRIRRVLSPES